MATLTQQEMDAFREGQMGLRPQPSMEDYMAAQNAWLYGYPANAPTYEDIMGAIYQQPASELTNTVRTLVTEPELPYYPYDFSSGPTIDSPREFSFRSPNRIFSLTVPETDFSPEEKQGLRDYIFNLTFGKTTPSINNNYAIPVVNSRGGSPAVIYPTGDIQYEAGPIMSPSGNWNYDPAFDFEQWLRDETAARLAYAQDLLESNSGELRNKGYWYKKDAEKMLDGLIQHRDNMDRINMAGVVQ